MLGAVVGIVTSFGTGTVIKAVVKSTVNPNNLTTMGKIGVKIGTLAIAGAAGSAVGNSWEKLTNECVEAFKNMNEETDGEEELGEPGEFKSYGKL